ncbi:phosphatidyl serine synthase-domain-containing protein [Chytridium lagenaria]|nr:phosphatidyl serine synthase-domain-containing protein [Chytridium lagenaria]
MFYTSRTITCLGIMIAGLIYCAFFLAGDDVVANTKLGIGAGFFFILLIGLLEFRDGPFIRPHPAFWRVVLAISVAYEIALVFVLFQDKHTMRQLLKYIDPSLGVPLPEKSYAEDCSITAETLWDQMDVFVLAHTLGWFAKSLILRDYWFCWILSVMFEIMEYSLAHQLPNFAECWWDHWVLDVLVTNWLGTYLGMKTCEYFAVKHYSWRGIKSIPSYQGKIQRSIEQFTPHSWTKFEWGTTKSYKNFVAVIALLYIELQCELNAFYLKYLLWLPSAHFLNVWRLIMYFFLCMPAVRESYQYLTDKKCKRLGMHAWMVTANILTEALICLKFGQNEFPTPAPKEVIIFWICLVGSVVGYAVWQFILRPSLESGKSEKTIKSE